MTMVKSGYTGVFTMQFREIEGNFVKLYYIHKDKAYEKYCLISEFFENEINPFELTNEMILFTAEESEFSNLLYDLSNIVIFEQRE